MACRVPQCLTIELRLQGALADRDVVPRQNAAMRRGSIDGRPIPNAAYAARIQRSPNSSSSDSIISV
jgi:hypothetical protein